MIYLYDFLKRENLYCKYERSFINGIIMISGGKLVQLQRSGTIFGKVIKKYIDMFDFLKLKNKPSGYFYKKSYYKLVNSEEITLELLQNLDKSPFVRISESFFSVKTLRKNAFRKIKIINLLGKKIYFIVKA
jgi:hypothetical protein